MKRAFCKIVTLILLSTVIQGCAGETSDISYASDDEGSQEEFDPETYSKADELLSQMTTEQKIYQLFFVTPETLTGEETVTTADSLKTALSDYPVGGIIFFADNLETEAQTKELLKETAEAAEIPLFLGVDQEGGIVSRLSKLNTLPSGHIPAMAEIGDGKNPKQAYEAGAIIASDLKELGFNMDFAPVADVLIDPNNTEIGSRAFSSDPQVCASMAAAVIKALHSDNIASCAKHFPGHGSTTSNSHDGKSVSSRTLEEFRSEEFVPFKAAISANTDFVMVSHMTAENIDSLPCSLSEKVISLLRDELGFKNIIITDAQNMGAITGFTTPDKASLMSLQAGADMVLMPLDFEASLYSIKEAVANGSLTEAALDEKVLRILKIKEARGLLEE